MMISIVLCTYNNCESLRKTLQNIFKNNLSKNNTELLVIDNNSTDDTRTVCDEFINEAPLHFSYYVEKKQGLSHARNLGLAKASGEYILFTDDDAIIKNDWLENYVSYLVKSPSTDCLFGPIYVDWENKKPEWFLQEYRPFFASLDYGKEILVIADIDHEFFGKNFMVRKSLLVEMGGFDPSLGRCGDKLIAGEETIIYRKLVNDKKDIVYLPQTAVGHRLKPREFTKENLIKSYRDSAYTTYNLSKYFGNKKIFGRPLFNLKIIANQAISLLKKLPKSKATSEKFRVHLYAVRLKSLLVVFLKNP